ncbi:hypothetical protein [Phaeobacter inhibens]|uniref:hypothetical protein n=1 Tax=Phaeobacter inhibens TaxID=221822 RepID=UPI0005C6B4D5|nr:hypothetical protein [Phaeobacter inhibens]
MMAQFVPDNVTYHMPYHGTRTRSARYASGLSYGIAYTRPNDTPNSSASNTAWRGVAATPAATTVCIDQCS